MPPGIPRRLPSVPEKCPKFSANLRLYSDDSDHITFGEAWDRVRHVYIKHRHTQCSIANTCLTFFTHVQEGGFHLVKQMYEQVAIQDSVIKHDKCTYLTEDLM